MTLERAPGSFGAAVRTALADPHMQEMLDVGTARLHEHRLVAWDSLEKTDGLRETARRIRTRTIARLDEHLDGFASAVESRGGKVAFCRTAEEANEYIVSVCRNAGTELVVKSKSMASEEIELNAALEAAGIDPVETDLGEYLLQLGGKHPAHIIAPAIELTREEVTRLLSEVEGRPVEPELRALTAAARRQLREKFLTAGVGITGANFGVAETGSIVLVTNEGNARLTSSIPRIHIALMGMERIVPTTAELAVLLQLLGRSGTGQPLTVYTTVASPKQPGDDGPDELHVVILDNGRSNLLGGDYQEMLNCIRCGACLNVCPVYRRAGGNAYGPVYSGPMGAVLVPLLVGLGNAPDLPHASSLCGACANACPVKIPLPDLLLDLRRDLVGRKIASRRERIAFSLWSIVWSRPSLYRLSTRVARLGQRIGRGRGPARAWSAGRVLPSLGKRYRDRR
jgi:L-lactate dehydrogenase complex protein LldF